MTVDEKRNKILTEVANNAVYAYGLSHVYSKKYGKLKIWSTASRVSGFLIPAVVGAIFFSYNNDAEILRFVIKYGSPLAIVQFALACYMSFSGNESNLIEFVKLSTKNRILAEDFHRLVKYPPDDIKDLEAEFNRLSAKESDLQEADETHGISPKEERIKMRFGLLSTDRKCPSCNEKPVSMTPTNCDVCGNF